MNEATIKEIIAELRDNLVGAKFGKIFVLGRDRFAVDLRQKHGKYLFISANPVSPRIYLITRKLKDLIKNEGAAGNFADLLRKRLSNARFVEISKIPDERVVEISFEASDASVELNYILLVQLTGRSSNVFLLDSNRIILDSLRSNSGEGQQKGEEYRMPPRPENLVDDPTIFSRAGYETLSAALDSHFAEKEIIERFRNRAESARAVIRAERKKSKRLVKKLGADLKNHGDPEKWKRLGDLLNANIATASITDGKVSLIDYFDETLPTIDVEIDERHTITEAAESYFKKYAKARNAAIEIKTRVEMVSRELEKSEKRALELEVAIKDEDEQAIANFLPSAIKKKEKRGAGSAVSKYAREYTSSDGFTILVGKRSKDNDHLTFRIAKSRDVWLHAADYPGSHVIIRRQGKDDIPQNTLLEAAMLAAFYSKAKKENKAAVRFTERKFVNKPKGAAPGLVSLSTSKTILVRPGVPESIIK